MNAEVPRRGRRLGTVPLRFSFDGRTYEGIAGDSVAAALLANGVRLMGRSVKFHRPRGVLTAGPEEPNALFTAGTRPFSIPNVSGTQLALREGLVIHSQNRWPTLAFDLASVLQVGGRFFGAGFYYKTFIWPSWQAYEGIIRNLAGLGTAPRACNLGDVAVEYATCDVLVGGGGPAGLAAALAATRAGAKVIMCEREPVCGGELEFENATIEGRPSLEWLNAALHELREHGARVLTESAVVDATDGMVIAHREPGGLPGANTVFKVRATAFVIAMGSVERPITFIDNDRPGVMLLSAAERYLARFGVRVGSDVVVFANHDRAYTSAARLLAGGLRVRAIVDTRSESEFAAGGEFAARARAELSRAGVECLLEHAVIAAVGGAAGMKGAIVGARSISGNSRSIACDALLVSGGWTPAVNAGTQDGGALRFSNDARAFTAAAQPAWRQSAGAADGMLELSDALASGHSAGDRAARYAGAQGSAGSAPRATGDSTPRLVPFWRSPANRSAEKRQFVDFQNDVTVADLRQALEEGFIDIEHIKRYTTLGVGTEQGSTGNFLGTMIVAELKGERVTEVGASRLRPPYHPVTLRSLAGHRVGLALRVARRTPLHDWHVAHGAALESMGLWMRPRYYRANGGDAYTAGVIEATRVRASGGITDGSTLGKIEIAGADAGAFLDRLYLTKASSIKAGRGKYMVNLREDGMVLDDGLVLRLSDDRFFATTSSAHAEGILSHLEYYCETEFAGQKVSVTDVTEAWAVIVVAGPESRATLFRVLGSEWQALLRRLAHMEFLAGRWREREVRVLRASFSGELAYELHCRPEIALQLWQALVDAGLSPYGLEALDILRIEKGYLASSEINGQTTPFDLGMQSLVKIGNSCVGSNLLDRAAFHEPTRPCLVGLRAEDGHGKFLAGAQLTAPNGSNRPCGFVTSSAFSPALGEWIGLGLAARSLATDASVLVARDPVRGGDTTVRVVSPVHFDSAGARLKS